MRRFITAVAFAALAAFPLLGIAQHNTRSQDARKAVLVTGANSGIGKQIALTLAENGFFVFAGARKAQDIDALSRLPNTQGIRLDVTLQADIDSAVETIRDYGAGLYGLVNNAGVFLFDPLIEVSEDDMRFIMDVNVLGPYRVTKAFAPMLIESKGRINTIGSIAGIHSGRLMGPYGMSKYAIESFTDSLASEMAKFDVHVSVIEPGNFRSDIMKNMQRRLAEISSGQRTTLFEDEVARFADFTKTDRSKHQAPTPVALAVLDFLSAEHPKRRYLVAPNDREAHFAVRLALQKAVQLNQGQPYSQSRDDLMATLDDLLAAADKASEETSP